MILFFSDQLWYIPYVYLLSSKNPYSLDTTPPLLCTLLCEVMMNDIPLKKKIYKKYMVMIDDDDVRMMMKESVIKK